MLAQAQAVEAELGWSESPVGDQFGWRLLGRRPLLGLLLPLGLRMRWRPPIRARLEMWFE